MQLSDNFSLEEFTRSQTAIALRIVNQPNAAQLENLKELAQRCQPLREEFGFDMIPTNALRVHALNVAVGGARDSSHLTGEAVDFADGMNGRRLARFCLSGSYVEDGVRRYPILEKYNLWMEDPQWTPGWVHLQIREVIGKRVYIPYAGVPPLVAKLKEQGGTV